MTTSFLTDLQLEFFGETLFTQKYWAKCTTNKLGNTKLHGFLCNRYLIEIVLKKQK